VKDYKSPSRLRVSCLYREHHESDPGDVDAHPGIQPIIQESCQAKSQLSMRDIAYYRFCCSWLRGLLKSNEEPPALAKRWSFHGPRGMDEVKRSICLLESMAPTLEFGLVPKQAQVHM